MVTKSEPQLTSSFKLLPVSGTYLRFWKVYGNVQNAKNPLTVWNYYHLNFTADGDHVSESSAWNKYN